MISACPDQHRTTHVTTKEQKTFFSTVITQHKLLKVTDILFADLTAAAFTA